MYQNMLLRKICYRPISTYMSGVCLQNNIRNIT